MKRFIALLLVLAMSLAMTACSQVSANDLMKDVPAKAVDVLPDMDAGASAAADFGVRLFQISMEEGKNTLISPLSVLYALAMTTNGRNIRGAADFGADHILPFRPDYCIEMEKVSSNAEPLPGRHPCHSWDS